MLLREEDEEGRTWDWPNWTGPGAGVLLGATVAVRVDDKVAGVLGGIVIFLLVTASDIAVRRRKARAEQRLPKH